MTRLVSWPRIFAEGTAIVVSILLAFAIQAWWEGRRERAIEHNYLVRLHAELTGGRAQLQTHYNRQLRTAAALDTLLDLAVEPETPERIRLAVTVLNGGSYDVNPYTILFDQTYGEMLATGGLGLIRDPELRAAITGYYRVAYRMSGILDAYLTSGYTEWQNRVQGAMGSMPRTWFSESLALANAPTSAEADRLVALLRPDTGWDDQVRFAKARVESVEFEMRELISATDSLIDVLAQLDAVQSVS